MKVTSRVWKALADDTRREMLAMISIHRRTASELGAPFAMSAPAVSQHLGVLLEAGLVDVERIGKYRVYQLAPSALHGVAEWVELLERRWEKHLDRLGHVVTRLASEENRGRHGRA